MNESNPQKWKVLEEKPWASNDNSVWLASTISLLRNIDNFEFPNKLSSDRRKQMLSLIGKELTSANGFLDKPTLYKAEDLTYLEKEYLGEHFLSPVTFHQAHAGEAFLIDNTGTFLTALNIQDHIQLTLLDCKGELENNLNKLIKIESSLDKKINFSFSPKFGFLTSNPTECGTALKLTIFLQLPALIHTEKIEEVLEKYADDNILITGLQGSPTELIGDVLALQNNYTLGLTEENIVSSLRNIATKLLVEENGTRNAIRHSQNPEIKDKISRAFGILIHSYNIEAIEAMNAIGLLKLGTEMGWIKGITLTELNNLFFNCRRAHLLYQFSDKVPHEEIVHKRAEFVHRSLKNVVLTI